MPEPTNEQAVMQQKMMKYMTVFMGLMFYKVASGLCLYFIASSLWGIAERKLLPKAQPARRQRGRRCERLGAWVGRQTGWRPAAGPERQPGIASTEGEEEEVRSEVAEFQASRV